MTDSEVNAVDLRLMGHLVEGEVVAVFRWGVIVDLRMSWVGLIDVLYIEDDDNCQVGDRVSCYLECFDKQKRKFILRPPGQVPLAERLRRIRELRDLSS
ncbi:hypothetical protein [Streptomyces sp. NPDC020996]|uniref:hypothetical protein n=1 Tax=Streptomyces sp. NPDC020996 TaxID=3154791 RepID=UPI003406135D